MNREEILEAVKSLAASQGFYGSILEQINNNPKALDYLEKLNFKDTVDLVLYFEQ